MTTIVLGRGAAASVVAVLAVLALGPGPVSGPAPAAAAELLPDLDQETPAQLDVRASGAPGRRTYRLGFGSGVRNVGTGPLVIEGRRADGSGMVARQRIDDDAGGPPRVVGGVGALRYVRSADHQHWHLLGFDRYELRPVGGGAPVRDRKSGFCLGDRYRVTTRRVPGAVPEAVYRSRCGLRRPGLRRVVEGISVGYGDFYAAHLEYQDLPLDGLAAGRYVLVHRVNADRALRESDYTNNAASLLLALRWRDGVPRVTVLASCPDRARCDAPARAAATRSAVVPAARPPGRGRAALCSLSPSGADGRPS